MPGMAPGMLRGFVVLAMAARAAEMPPSFSSALRASRSGAEDRNRLISGLVRMGVLIVGGKVFCS